MTAPPAGTRLESMTDTAPTIETLEAPVLRPAPGVAWAETGILNPAVIDEPGSSRLHMLFRASGPWPQARRAGQPLPYPIFLGYASSDDAGRTWQADLSRPALAPALETEPDKIRIRARDGGDVVNHANGCIEDPRLFRLDGRLYCTTACRMFPPGPYWECIDLMQCSPAWAREGAHEFGMAATENVTVSVLWEVDLDALRAGDYERAFSYVTHLTDPERGDNRDVFLLPAQVPVNGTPRYLCFHRPHDPSHYGQAYSGLAPAIFLAAASRLEDFATSSAEHRLLAVSELPWEGDRIGASWVPLPLKNGEWLLPYHGKCDSTIGYTQSFMILESGADGWPVVKNRCSDRVMYARRDWELSGVFKTPCVFTCGGLVQEDGRLLMTYGAADTVSGVAWTDLVALVGRVRCFDPHGQAIPACCCS